MFMPIGPDGKRIEGHDLISGRIQPAEWQEMWVHGSRTMPDMATNWRECIAGPLATVCNGALPPNWEQGIGASLRSYRVLRFKESMGADESAVLDAISRIEKVARKLKEFADLPKAEAAVFEAAWRRIDHSRHQYDRGEPLRDALYPGLSLLTGRMMVMRQQKRIPAIQFASLSTLIQSLAPYVEANGGRATGSNGIVRKSGPGSLTAFASLVKMCLLIAGQKPPCKLTDAAINRAVLNALKKRGDNKG